jgi:hypothetical protein
MVFEYADACICSPLSLGLDAEGAGNSTTTGWTWFAFNSAYSYSSNFFIDSTLSKFLLG